MKWFDNLQTCYFGCLAMLLGGVITISIINSFVDWEKFKEALEKKGV